MDNILSKSRECHIGRTNAQTATKMQPEEHPGWDGCARAGTRTKDPHSGTRRHLSGLYLPHLTRDQRGQARLEDGPPMVSTTSSGTARRAHRPSKAALSVPCRSVQLNFSSQKGTRTLKRGFTPTGGDLS